MSSGRRIKEGVDWYKHANNSRGTKKMLSLRNIFGTQGYGVWIMFKEVLTASDNSRKKLDSIELMDLAGDFGVPEQFLSELIDYALKIELLKKDTEGYLYNSDLTEMLSGVYQHRSLKRELIKQSRRDKKGNFQKPETDPGISNQPLTINNLPERKEAFLKKLELYIPQYGKDMVHNFGKYWTEHNEKGFKMRWEKEGTYNISDRLAYWSRNENKFNRKNNGGNEATQRKKIRFIGGKSDNANRENTTPKD